MVYQELHHSVRNSFPKLVKLHKLQFSKFLAWFRGQGSGSCIGKSKFQTGNYYNLTADLDSLQKSTNVSLSSFFYIFRLLWVKSGKHLKFVDKRATMFLCWQIWTVFLDFSHENIWIKKNGNHFTFILFCKESKSAIKIGKFLFQKFDLCIPLKPPDGW